ncbi:MAG: hypothetical protein ACKOC8_07740 [Pirellulales bacterium]
MDHRLGRTLRVFLVVLAAAGFYRLAVVPIVEPRVRDTATLHEMSPEEAAAIRARADQRLASLGDIFPPGSWERDSPIMLESRQMRLLFKEYHSLPDGRVNLTPCTLVVLPDRNRAAGSGPQGRTLVLRAPQGAVLEFDEPLDLRQGRLARLVGGSLRGQVTIRGTPSAPGAEDDIEIVTREIELDELEVRTGELVQFRHGRSSGSGRGLVARLKPRPGGSQATGPGPGDKGPNIGGVDSLRLDRDVSMRIEGVAGGMLPGAASRPAADGANQVDQADQPPVLVTCRGAMCLNVSANVITLEDHVDVVRATADGSTDQLSCDLLAIVLARRSPPAAGQPAGGRGGLEPVEIQAKGSPVVARSTAADLEARAARLGYEIQTRRILLDGEDPVSLVAKGTEMEARKIDYCPGPPGDPGSLMAVGPGWLRVRSAGSPPAQARWQQWLRMRPDGAGHVVSLSGDADVTVETQGRLCASEMHLWLDVVKDKATSTARDPAAGPDLSGVRPSRLLARGMVEADAEQASARTDRLELWFRTVAPRPAAPAVPQQAAAAPAPVSRAATAAAHPTPPPRPAPAPTRGRMVASAALVRGQVTLGPGGTEVDEMSMEGQVRLVEQPPQQAAGGVPGEPGIEILGDQMQVTRATAADAKAIVSGRPAVVKGRGLDLEGPMVEFDRGHNRLAVDGAGRLSLPMAGGAGGLDALALTGPPRAAAAAPGQPEKLDVTWQGRLDFDGQTARFIDTVVAASRTASVRAGSLDVIFDRPFDFAAGEAGRGARQPDVAKIACGAGVKIESESVDETGQASTEQLFVRDLVVDRASGDVAGTGPGRLTSTRAGQPPAMSIPAGPQGPGAVAVQPVAAAVRPDGLTYLGVDFQRGLRGNVHRRSMEFHQRVEAIWGPVARRGDTLDSHAAGGLPEGAITIGCDVLAVGQSPPLPGHQRSSIEIGAGGNVLVEGESFTARSARLTWSEAKDLLVFEGDGRSDAQLYRQLKAGAQPSSASAGKILYWRALNRVDVEDARYLDLDQLRGGGGAGLPQGIPAAAPTRPPPRPPGT